MDLLISIAMHNIMKEKYSVERARMDEMLARIQRQAIAQSIRVTQHAQKEMDEKE